MIGILLKLCRNTFHEITVAVEFGDRQASIDLCRICCNATLIRMAVVKAASEVRGDMAVCDDRERGFPSEGCDSVAAAPPCR